MTIVVDTGVLLASADEDDADHERCAELLRRHRGELMAPAPVIPETAWQIERNLGPSSEAGFLRLITTHQLSVVDLSIEDYQRCIDLIETYQDLRLGLVDASVITVAENLGVTTLATLNDRDFRVVSSPRRCIRTHPLTPTEPGVNPVLWLGSGAGGRTMRKSPHGTWVVQELDQAAVERLTAAHSADPLAVELGVDLVADPNREDDEGYVWTRLHTARDVRVVVPGSAVVIGSDVGEWVAKVIAWDFEVSDDDPIVTLEVVPLTPRALAGALARRRTPTV